MSDLYTGAMGILSYMNKLDVVANNIANSQTNGYKADNVTFKTFEETHLVERNFEDKRKVSNNYEDMVYMDDVKTNFDAGNYQPSNNELDMAIADQTGSNKTNFFIVNKNGKDYLTRNGQFTLDEERRLSTYTGELVLGTNGNPITIPQGATYSINKTGEIRLSDTNQVIGKIQVAAVDNTNLGFLEKDHGSLFTVLTPQEFQNKFGNVNRILSQFNTNDTYKSVFENTNALQQLAQTGQINILEQPSADIQSNTTESSNVDLANELTELMSTQNGVKMSSDVWNTMSQVLDKASNQIGK